MTDRPLTEADRELIDITTAELEDHFKSGYHHTACGLRTRSGSMYTSINLIAPTGPAQVHCESIALGKAIQNNETDIEVSAAVRYVDDDPTREPRVISACGVCRELYWAYTPDIDIIIPGDDGPVKVALSELLPAKG